MVVPAAQEAESRRLPLKQSPAVPEAEPALPCERPEAPWASVDLLAGMGLAFILNYWLLSPFVTAAARQLGISGSGNAAAALELLRSDLWHFVLLGGVMAFSVGRYRGGWRSLGFRSFPVIRLYLPVAALAGSFSVLAVYEYLVRALHLTMLSPKSDTPTALFSHSTPLVVIACISLCVVGPLTEEIVFRGVIFRGLAGRRLPFPQNIASAPLGVGAAALLSGFLFAAAHLQFGLLIPFACTGALFAWVCQRSGSLWASILTHAANNTIVTVVLLVLAQHQR